MTPPDDRSPPPLPLAFGDPVPYAMPVEVPIDPRPASVRAIGIIGIIFGGFALLTPLLTAMQLLMPVNANATFSAPGRPPTTMPAYNPTAEMFARPMLPWTITLQATAVVMGAWLLWSAIATFKLRERGRRSMLAYAACAIVFALAAGVANALYIMPTLFAGMAAPRGPLSPVFVQVFAIAIGVGGAIVGTIFPTCILVFLRRPHVVAAFANPATPSR